MIFKCSCVDVVKRYRPSGSVKGLGRGVSDDEQKGGGN
jgi:hypothetical protein